MKSFKTIVGINLLVLLGYSVTIRIFTNGGLSHKEDEAMGILIYSAFAVGLHAVISLLIALGHFASRDRETGRAWLAATGLVLLVGFSVCLGNANL